MAERAVKHAPDDLVPRVAPVAADFALSAGFGSTASIDQLAGHDRALKGRITSAGTGQGANPTCTYTFKRPYPTGAPPIAVASRLAGGSQMGVGFAVSTTETTLVLTFLGTPVAAETYGFHVMLLDSA